MPLPELNIQYPDVGQIAGNYLKLRQMGAVNRAMDRQQGYDNWLQSSGYRPGAPGAENILQSAPTEYAEQVSPLLTEETKRQQMEMSRNATAMRMAMDAKSPEMAKTIMEQYAPGLAGKVDYKDLGPEVEFTLDDGTKVKGPREAVANMLEIKQARPDIMTDPQQAAPIYAQAAREGLSIYWCRNICSSGKRGLVDNASAEIQADHRGRKAD